MIKPNWKIFQAKFSDNTTENFEWFSYLLFCKQYKQSHGIFRYKNQSAIETNPIEIDNEVIGWQAKFYEVRISEHKKDLLDTIDKARRDYPNITKLLIYTNQEWGQDKGKKPKGQVEVENKAKSSGIELEWRAPSFFESEFVCDENKNISQHFFSLDKSIFNLIEEQEVHNENILSEIRSSIHFKSHEIDLDRTIELEKLKNETKQIKILSGVGGVGKTAVIKKLYDELDEESSFFVFKATEFEVRHINDLFKDFSFYDFANALKDDTSKVVVIDSAEKLLDLNNTDPFKEFLTVLIKNKWQIIFTTRDHYLENLNYDFSEIYNITPININIGNLKEETLISLSKEYDFFLPKDEKLCDLIKNPFYLSAYLKHYNEESSNLNYSDFKTKLWAKNIKNNKPERERCFFKVAFERANSGQFYINPDFDSSILYELIQDGVLGYEEMGYFITHDIYEEWALEKIIENSFLKRASEEIFFNEIGQSLAIRRSFRNWLSEKLLLEDENIKQFIEDVIENKEIDIFWKDEVFVSILLSNYSEVFFELFENELLENNQELLKRITFILRLACKEIDDEFFEQLGIRGLNVLSFKYAFTKPKGQGWKSIINFVFNNISKIGIKNINFILPVVHDWNSKVKEGNTTRVSSLIALQFYEWIIKDDVYWSKRETEEKLLQTILYGASEIKNELETIFDNVIKNKWNKNRDPYYSLSEMVLTKMEGVSLVKVLPKKVLELAELYWTLSEKKKADFYSSKMEVDEYFGLEKSRSDYYPASAYQTPIYWLLQHDLINTIDFILKFVNKSVEAYANSSFDSSVKQVKVYINEGNVKKQYMSNCLWHMYRGVGSPVTPYLLQSIHMALEKFILENAKYTKDEVFEGWLIFLLMNSESASISSVVASIVLAYPDKTFNVAKILFNTKEFIIEDKHRIVLENRTESLYSIGKNWGVNNHELYDNERLKTCKDKHRETCLEDLFLKYQCFRNEGVSEEEAEERQKRLWEILDNYYEQLSKDDSEKTWRLFLARMDRRKMTITTEKVDKGVQIQFNPELDDDLKNYSEESRKDSFEPFKYSTLNLWASYRLEKEEKYKEYEQYENNPKQAFIELKELIEKFNNEPTKEFIMVNRSTPSFVCSVLLRDFIEKLNEEEKIFCKDIVIEMAKSAFNKNYNYQISDGIQESFSLLPIVMNEFPDDKPNVKILLLLGLFKQDRVGGMMDNHSFSIFPTVAIHQLWKSSFEDAQSLLIGYILLLPKFDELFSKIREENYQKNIYRLNTNQILERFLDENTKAIEDVVNCELELDEIDIQKLDLNDLNTLFKLIPSDTKNELQKDIVKNIVFIFSEKIFSDEDDEKIDYMDKHNFLKNYAHFVLNLEQNEIKDFIEPFINKFNQSETMADLLKEFVLAEDYLNTYDNFWIVWNIFKEKIFEISQKGDGYWYVDKIIRSYLFAEVPWKEDAKEWRSFKEKQKRFFREVSSKIGHCPSTLYSISKLLNDIGSIYLDDGIGWFSTMLEDKNYITKKLETNTIYYLENSVKRYIFKNREAIKRSVTLKNKLLVILNFLIEKGSVTGYMLRESII